MGGTRKGRRSQKGEVFGAEGGGQVVHHRKGVGGSRPRVLDLDVVGDGVAQNVPALAIPTVASPTTAAAAVSGARLDPWLVLVPISLVIVLMALRAGRRSVRWGPYRRRRRCPPGLTVAGIPVKVTTPYRCRSWPWRPAGRLAKVTPARPGVRSRV